MHHVFYLDGNARKTSWVIQTNESISEQSREHIEMYKDKISNLQSKYVALHIGLFWGIGVFIIKNDDHVKVKLDDEKLFEQLTVNQNINNEFIVKRIKFINQLIAQRKLKVEYELIQQENNLAKKTLDAKELKTKND
ncbi:hypothetical protein C5F47_06335 [Nitrosopumilus cobalaminigenes]|uniref:Uncharacterized protein n=2 Tax=Nitrosopumilus cobalaminigenes TaxID=1470066 RepID=A0A7D5M0V8_9ARCH|nr:hypothetical protein C5F47_06335 [Nitrosopumilus cobalaminigenes]